MNETVKRILALMKQKGDTAHSLEVNANFPSSSVFSWKSDRNKPSMDAIIKLARYFNVSSDYLLCLSDEPMPLKQSSSAEYSADLMLEIISLLKDKRFVELVKLYKAMPERYKERAVGYLTGLADGAGIKTE